ncbi:MAG: hypothetical protein JST00_03760 [Deltaproteobacteria bacterium]|nr:hypothetical protein [Deltaproteobacteria bacterium]
MLTRRARPFFACLLPTLLGAVTVGGNAEAQPAAPTQLSVLIREETLGNVSVVRRSGSVESLTAVVTRNNPPGFEYPRRFRIVFGSGTPLPGGVVVASAYDRGVCAVEQWGPITAPSTGARQLQVDVAYYPLDPDRTAPATCAVSYTRVNDRNGVQRPLAYGFFGFPTVPQQVAPAPFAFNSAATDSPRATRTAAGRYRVDIPNMAVGDVTGNVILTPYGPQHTSDRLCRAGALVRGAGEALAFEVRCDDTRTRAPTDTAFTFLFTRGGNAGGGATFYSSGIAGPNGLSNAAGRGAVPTVPSPPTYAGGTIGNLFPGALMLTTSMKDDSTCRPTFGPSGPSIGVRCDGPGTGSFYFLGTR